MLTTKVPGTRQGRPILESTQFQLLSPRAVKLLDYLWQGRTVSGPRRTNSAQLWMRETGITGRGVFFETLRELEAHDLIQVEQQRDEKSRMSGMAITLRQPPETVPAEAFEFYEQNLLKQLEGIQRRLQELRRCREDYFG